MIDIYEKCSCNAREKSKCVKESNSGYGKMCVKEIKAEREFNYDLNKMQESMDSGMISLPRGQTHEERRAFIEDYLITLDAQTALDMLDSPEAPTEELIKLMRLK